MFWEENSYLHDLRHEAIEKFSFFFYMCAVHLSDSAVVLSM